MSSPSTKFSYSAAVKARANVSSSETAKESHQNEEGRLNKPPHIGDGPTSNKDDFNAEEVRRYLNEYWEAMANKLIDTEIDKLDLPVIYRSSSMDSNLVSSDVRSGKMADGRDLLQVLQEQLDKTRVKH